MLRFCFCVFLLLFQIECANYTNASLQINRSAVLSTYSSLSSIDPYLVEIEDSYQIYPNLQQVCNYQRQTQNYIGQTDVWLCFQTGLVIISCNVIWEVKINCGTFVEIHRPLDPEVLASRSIEQADKSINLALNELCAGVYHIWFIYSTRIGKVIKTVEPIFINYPFCG